MRAATIEGITHFLGEPDQKINDNQKVIRWNVSPNLDVVVQRDTSDDEQCIVWVTDHASDGAPSWSEVYPAGKGRHSGTYDKCPTMIEGKPARKITITEKGQISETIRYLKRLKGTAPNALAKRDGQIKPALKGFVKGLKAFKLVPLMGFVGEWADLADDILNEVDQHETEKRLRNLALLMQNFKAKQKGVNETVEELDARMETMEAELESTGLLDSFHKVVRDSLADDEAQKQPIYAALLHWIVKGKEADEIRRRQPNPISVKMLSSAVKELSYLELTAFFEMVRAQRGRPKVQPYMDDNHFWMRVENAGLSPRGTKHNGGASDLGQILFNICMNLDLKPVQGTHD